MEAFGTAWAVDDEEECPTPPPIPDICEDFGLATEKAGFEAHVRSVLKGDLFVQLFCDLLCEMEWGSIQYDSTQSWRG